MCTMGRIKKDPSQVRRNFVAFYTTDSVKNWIDETRGLEKQSSFLHRRMEKLKRLEESGSEI